MLRLLQKLLYRKLDLDRIGPRGEMRTIEIEADGSFHAWQVWHLLRAILYQSIGDRATAICFFRGMQEDDDCMRMMYCLPVDGDTWYEMVPPPPKGTRQMIALICRACGIGHDGTEGKLPYLYQRQLHSATCVSRSPDELVIYLTDYRPPLIDKSAGHKPGIPMAENLAATGSAGMRPA